jgi:hypothetical protein
MEPTVNRDFPHKKADEKAGFLTVSKGTQPFIQRGRIPFHSVPARAVFS